MKKHKPTLYNSDIRFLAEHEGKVSQVSVQNLREVYGVLAKRCATDPAFLFRFLKIGMRRKART